MRCKFAKAKLDWASAGNCSMKHLLTSTGINERASRLGRNKRNQWSEIKALRPLVYQQSLSSPRGCYSRFPIVRIFEIINKASRLRYEIRSKAQAWFKWRNQITLIIQEYQWHCNGYVISKSCFCCLSRWCAVITVSKSCSKWGLSADRWIRLLHDLCSRPQELHAWPGWWAFKVI